MIRRTTGNADPRDSGWIRAIKFLAIAFAFALLGAATAATAEARTEVGYDCSDDTTSCIFGDFAGCGVTCTGGSCRCGLSI
jgi:hypothetical protein